MRKFTAFTHALFLLKIFTLKTTNDLKMSYAKIVEKMFYNNLQNLRYHSQKVFLVSSLHKYLDIKTQRWNKLSSTSKVKFLEMHRKKY